MARAKVIKRAAPTLAEKAAKLSVPAMAGILAAALALLAGAFYMLIYSPYSEEAESVKNRINNTRSEVSKQQAILAKHTAVGNHFEAIAAAYQFMAHFIPKDEDMPRLVQMVSEIGSRAGLTDGVKSFVPKAAIIRENFAEIPFDMTLEGEFLSVLNFLYDFSRIDRIVNIVDVQVGSPKMVDERREIFHVQLKCAGSTYRTLTDAENEAQMAARKGGAKKK